MDFNDTENQFAILAETLPQLVWSARPDGYLDYFNRRWREFTGVDPEKSMGDSWQELIHPYDLQQVLSHWRRSLETGQSYEGEFRLRNASGTYVWMLSRAIPIQDLSGQVVRWFGTSTNIDAQKKAEEALRDLELQHRLALEAASLGIWKMDLEKGEISWDKGTCALHRISHQSLVSLPLEEALSRVHPDDQNLIRERIQAAIDRHSDGQYVAEYRVRLHDGELRWFRSHGQVHFTHEEGSPRATSISGVISDITERRASEEAQQLLTRELNHRVKNLFAIANGMVSMTARTAKDPKEMATALRGRLSALSRAHELVQPVTSAGHGAGAEVELASLIEAVLEPYWQVGTNQITVEGPSVRVGSNATTSLALVLHELATNAAKYGCLSSSEGELTICWTIQSDQEDLVDISWLEQGGPPIEAAPSFEGFGTQLSQRSIAGQLGGTLDRDWLPEGLRVRMTLPVSRLVG